MILLARPQRHARRQAQGIIGVSPVFPIPRINARLAPAGRRPDSTTIKAFDFLWRREYSGMTYSAFINEFLREAQLPRLSAQEPLPDRRLIQRVEAAKDDEIAAAGGQEAMCSRSLLLMAAGDLDQAHRIVQAMSTSEGAYIHGLIHRIDDDFDNARYWFRRAGAQSATTEMYRRASVVSATVASRSNWDPFLVTDMLETSRNTGVTEELRTILTIEFEELLVGCRGVAA
jgi:hypothetical protein